MSRASEFFRFVFVGVLNTVLDFGVLNALLFLTGKQELVFYSLFKTISFSVVVIFSFFMNRSFVFKKQGDFKVFLIVSIAAALLNVSSAALAVKFCGTYLGQNLFIFCANFGVFFGILIAFVPNFFGYKLLVFKTQK